MDSFGHRRRDAVEMYWYHNRVTQRVAEGEVVPGVYFPAFIHNGDFYLASIVAYKDGMVDCWGLVPFEEFKQKVRDGWVVTSIPDGARVDIHHVARFTVRGVSVFAGESLHEYPGVAADSGRHDGFS
jgi:hypothetical protein